MEPNWLADYRKRNETTLPTLSFPLDGFLTERAQVCRAILPTGLIATPNVFVQMESCTLANRLTPEAKTTGIILTDIQTAIAKHPDLVKQTLPTLTDPLSKLAASRFTNGLFLHVSDNTTLELVSQTVAGLHVNVLNLIIVGTNAKLTLTHHLTGEGAVNQHTHVCAGAGAIITYCAKQTAGKESIIIDNLSADAHESATVRLSAVHLGGKHVISRRDTTLNGANSNLTHTDIAFADDSQRYQLTANAIHNGQHTTGSILTHSLVKDTAKVSARGLLTIGEHGHHADSFVAQHAILLNKGAAAECVPDLEIHTSDVKASHAASVTPINKEHLFYLETRGFNEQTARQELALGSIEPALARMPDDFAALIRGAIENKWSAT